MDYNVHTPYGIHLIVVNFWEDYLLRNAKGNGSYSRYVLRYKNAIQRRMDYVDVPSSKLKEAILELLKREGLEEELKEDLHKVESLTQLQGIKARYIFCLYTHLLTLTFSFTRSIFSLHFFTVPVLPFSISLY